jgi:toxin ParE1/3/4
MPQFKVSSNARQDLFDIGIYTQNQFGIKQRRLYLNEVADKFALLANKPEIGIKRYNLRTDYYSILIKKHIVFYKKQNYGIRIIRVLHQSMEFDKHL